MADVFISYSRKDKDFIRWLQEILEKHQRDVWVDLEDILPTEEWLKKIYASIEAANNFVFVVSPDSVASKVCAQEVSHAVENHKRLIPVLHRNVDDNAVPLALAARNWIYLRETDDFNGTLDWKLLAAASRDLKVRMWHTATGRKAVTPMQHERLVTAMAFSWNGRYLVTGENNNTARVWHWRPEDLIHPDESYRKTCLNLPGPEPEEEERPGD